MHIVVRDLLKPTGKLISPSPSGWLNVVVGGAPFSTTNDDIFSQCSKTSLTFDIVFEPPDSVESRKGKEIFCLMSVIKCNSFLESLFEISKQNFRQTQAIDLSVSSLASDLIRASCLIQRSELILYGEAT